jgi:hypothetical protein
MSKAKFQEILTLLELQKQALTELALELAAPTAQSDGVKARTSLQQTIIFRAKIEERVRELAITAQNSN